MAKESLFTFETQVISKSKAIVEDESNHISSLYQEFTTLSENYEKLFRQFSRIISINDKQQLELIEARDEIQTYADELKILNATKDKFFSIISHDLKGPIISYLNMATIMLNRLDRMSKDDIRELAEFVKERGDNLMKLMENLLHWARLQMDGIDFRPQEFALAQQVSEVTSLLESQAAEKQIQLNADTPDHISILADPEMLNTILRNLVSNAIKFTPRDGRIEIRSMQQPDCVEIAVADSGVGMSQKDQDKLFRLDTIYTGKGTENETGTGLGLILCKEMAEKHQGSLNITSEEGRGTTVTLILPNK